MLSDYIEILIERKGRLKWCNSEGLNPRRTQEGKPVFADGRPEKTEYRSARGKD